MSKFFRKVLTRFYFMDEFGQFKKVKTISRENDIFFVGRILNLGKFILDSKQQLDLTSQTLVDLNPYVPNVKIILSSGCQEELEILFFGPMKICLEYCEANCIDSTTNLNFEDEINEVSSEELAKNESTTTIVEIDETRDELDTNLTISEESLIPLSSDNTRETLDLEMGDNTLDEPITDSIPAKIFPNLSEDQGPSATDSIGTTSDIQGLPLSAADKSTNITQELGKNQTETMEKRLSVLEEKMDILMDTNKKILEKLNSDSEVKQIHCYKPERAVELSYQSKLVKILTRVRFADEWRKKIHSYKDERIPEDILKKVKVLFLSGTNNATTFVRRLGEIVFGSERLLKTIMGKDGKPLKGIKRGVDREIFFPPGDESLMKDLMSLISEDLFKDEDVFEFLVRRPLNQCGRDAKKPKEGRKRHGKGSSSAKKRHLNPSQSKIPMLPITSYFDKPVESQQ